MRWHSFLAGSLAFLFFTPCLLRADEPAMDDPVRLVPAHSEVVIKLDRPRALVETIYKHEAVQALLRLEAAASYFDNTNIRRLFQLLTYLEKQLGHDRYELLDKLAGRGIALGVQINEGKPALTLVLGARDDKVLGNFVQTARTLIDQELDRQEVRAKLTKAKHRDIDYWRLGDGFFMAHVGSNLVIATKEPMLHAALDAHRGDSKGSVIANSRFAESAKLRPLDGLAWLWLDLKQVRTIPAVKTVFDQLTLDPQFLIFSGGLIDVLKRSDFICASFSRQGEDFLTRVAMPCGREGMSKAAVMFLPVDKNGSLPMLKPPRAISSTSYYLDLGNFWDHRKEILNEKQVEALDRVEKQSALFLGGVKLGALLKQAGKYHRIVAANQDKPHYKIKPASPIPSFAVILDMRDPAFAKSMNTILRGAALLGSFQFGLRLVEEKHGSHTLVTYYFPEDKKLEADQGNIRFNFSPCFTHVGDQFVISSSLELGRDLVDLLEKENRANTSAATTRTHLYAKGVAANLTAGEEQLLTQFVLGQGLSLKAARDQVRDLGDLIGRLGQLHLETSYGANEFRFDIRLQADKK